MYPPTRRNSDVICRLCILTPTESSHSFLDYCTSTSCFGCMFLPYIIHNTLFELGS